MYLNKNDVGCYADGSLGHAYVRGVLATLLERLPESHDDTDASRYQLANELREDMTDDAGEEDDALEILQEHTAEGLTWEFHEGDLILGEDDSV